MQAAYPPEDLDMVLSLTPMFWSRFGGSRLLMTGGTGFVGNWLMQVAQRANDKLGSRIELVALTRNPDRARQQMPQVFERADTRLIAGDIRDFAAPSGKVDLVIHAAAEVGNPRQANQPREVFDTIVLGTRRALDISDESGATRFLLTSSGAVYGTQPPTLDRIAEDYTGAPHSLEPAAAYANAKRAAEWLTAASAQSGLGACAARVFALIGPGLPLNGTFAAGNFIRDGLAGQAIQISGNGSPVRSFMYMADLCVWLLRILGNGAPGQAYNVGSEHALSIAEFASLVGEATGVNTAVASAAPAPTGAVPRYVPDTRKARTELDLSEYTDLRDAVRKTVHWSRSSVAS